MQGLKESVLESLTRLLYRDSLACNTIFDEEWDVLIILDACRFDVFAAYSHLLPSRGKLSSRKSCASHTAEFIKKNFIYLIKNNYRFSLIKRIVYISANPMVDNTLGRYRKYFYKYIPVWKYAWNEKMSTVLPEDTTYYALKTYINLPKNNYYKIIIHFLQPHGPYIGPLYGSKVTMCFTEEVKKFIKQYIITNPQKEESFLLNIFKHYLKPILSQGMLNGYPGLNTCFTLNDLIKSYIENFLITLPFVNLLLKTFPGKIIVTSDHGEAFGEWLHRFVPIRVIGHFSRIHLDALIKIPWYSIENSFNNKEAVKKALRGVLKLRRFRNNPNSRK